MTFIGGIAAFRCFCLVHLSFAAQHFVSYAHDSPLFCQVRISSSFLFSGVHITVLPLIRYEHRRPLSCRVRTSLSSLLSVVHTTVLSLIRYEHHRPLSCQVCTSQSSLWSCANITVLSLLNMCWIALHCEFLHLLQLNISQTLLLISQHVYCWFDGGIFSTPTMCKDLFAVFACAEAIPKL